MATNLFNQKEFFDSLLPGQFVRSYFNPEKIFEVKEGTRKNLQGQEEKQIQTTNFDQKEHWITEMECNAKTIML